MKYVQTYTTLFNCDGQRGKVSYCPDSGNGIVARLEQTLIEHKARLAPDYWTCDGMTRFRLLKPATRQVIGTVSVYDADVNAIEHVRQVKSLHLME